MKNTYVDFIFIRTCKVEYPLSHSSLTYYLIKYWYFDYSRESMFSKYSIDNKVLSIKYVINIKKYGVLKIQICSGIYTQGIFAHRVSRLA